MADPREELFESARRQALNALTELYEKVEGMTIKPRSKWGDLATMAKITQELTDIKNDLADD